MKKIIEYEIMYKKCCPDGISGFEKLINEYIKDGWQPIGSYNVHYHANSNDESGYSQTMVKYED